LASWKQAALGDLQAIWHHHIQFNGLDYADGMVTWLVALAEQIDPMRCPLLNEDTRKFVKDGYVFMVRPSQDDVEVIGVFGPGQNWTDWIGRR
jgi:hypothetical protein